MHREPIGRRPVGTTWWDPPRVFGLNNQNRSSQNQGCQWEYPWNGQDQSILLALNIMEPLSRPRTPSFFLGFSRRESFRSPTAKGESERVGVVQGVPASYFLFDIKGCDFTLGLDPFSIHPLFNLHQMLGTSIEFQENVAKMLLFFLTSGFLPFLVTVVAFMMLISCFICFCFDYGLLGLFVLFSCPSPWTRAEISLCDFPFVFCFIRNYKLLRWMHLYN